MIRISKHAVRGSRPAAAFVSLGAACLAMAAVAACASRTHNDEGVGDSDATQAAPAPKQKLDVNDVSFLWPLAKTPANKDAMLRLGDAGDKSALLAPDVFKQVIADAKAQALRISGDTEFSGFRTFESLYADYAQYRIVGYRFDPCAPRVDDPACLPELRLVAQPIVAAAGAVASAFGSANVGAIDFALHLVYEAPKADVARITKELRNLKRLATAAGVTTSGTVLGVHPAFVKQGISGEFAKALRSHVTANMGTKTLKKVTFFGSSDGITAGEGTRWVFTESRGKAGKLVLGDMPILRESDSSPQVFAQMFDGGASPADRPFVPEPPGARAVDGRTLPPRPERRAVGAVKNPHSLSIYFTPEYLTTTRGSKLSNDAEYRRLLVANPLAHTIDTTDCVSCHMVSHPRHAESPPEFASAVEKYKVPAGVTGKRNTALSPKLVYVLRAFGHTETAEVVNERVVNESAAVADYLNRTVPE